MGRAAVLATLFLPTALAAVELEMGKSGENLELTWTGGTPAFQIYRAAAPQGVIDPLNHVIESVATTHTASPGGPDLEFFRVIGRPAVDVTGSWTTTIDFAGSARPVTLQLHQRARGRVLGHVLGGTSLRTVLDGRVVDDRLTLRLQFREPWTVQILTLDGTATATTIAATLADGSPITLIRRTDILHERNLGLFDLDAAGEPTSLAFVSVVQDDVGHFVSGGFAGMEDCGLWACSGGLSAFADAAGTIALAMETDGGCSAGSSATLAWDPGAGFHTGSYTFNDCGGSTSGTLLGVNGWRTRSDHVAEVLAALGAIADNLETGTPFSVPHPAFADDYLWFGTTLADRFAELNAEIAQYARIRADFHTRRIDTVDDPDTYDFIDAPPMANFEELRVGIPTIGGAPQSYLDTARRSIPPRLGGLDRSGGAWVIRGNGSPALDEPFDYSYGASQLIADTPHGEPAYITIGPYGSHFPPNTGHIDGNSKHDAFGFVAADDSELVELAGDLDGIREPGETWAYWGGSDGERIRDRRVVYRAPLDATIFEVEFEGSIGYYFEDPPSWTISMKFAGGERMRLVHVGRIEPELRDLILAASAGAIDTDSYAGPEGDILQGLRIAVPALTELGRPQIEADPVPGFPGFYQGRGGSVPVPHAHMEWIMGGYTSGGDIADPCFYDFISPADRTAHQAILDADMTDPDAYAYEWEGLRPWQYRAEAELCAIHSEFPVDFGALTTRRGGWFERETPGVSRDEILAYIPIRKDVAAYDPLLYHSPDAVALIHRKRTEGALFSWTMPDLTIAEPYWPSGEILTDDGAAWLIKWRTTGLANGDDMVVFQRAAYRLDATGLTVKWGPFANSEAAAVQPVLSPAEACDGSAVVCYDHDEFDDFRD